MSLFHLVFTCILYLASCIFVLYTVEKGLAPCYCSGISAVFIYFDMEERLSAKFFLKYFSMNESGPQAKFPI